MKTQLYTCLDDDDQGNFGRLDRQDNVIDKIIAVCGRLLGRDATCYQRCCVCEAPASRLKATGFHPWNADHLDLAHNCTRWRYATL